MSGALRVVPHPAFVAARSCLSRALASAGPGQLVFVVGLSGAGKSVLRQEAMRLYAGSPRHWGIGRLPVISVRATPSDKSMFSPKEFMGRLNFAVQEPTTDWLDDGDPDVVHLKMEVLLAGEVWKGLRRNLSEMNLRASFERMARGRGVKAVFVEEAASITHVHTGKLPTDHMVNYMCLAEEIGATFVMFGVPRIKALWHGNAEIRRRSRLVYVSRYRCDSEHELRAFASVVMSVAKQYPLLRSDTLVNHMDMIFYATAGIYGEVKEFFARADECRAVAGRSGISLADLEAAVYPNAELETLHRDAALFDRMLKPAKVKFAKDIASRWAGA